MYLLIELCRVTLQIIYTFVKSLLAINCSPEIPIDNYSVGLPAIFFALGYYMYFYGEKAPDNPTLCLNCKSPSEV